MISLLIYIEKTQSLITLPCETYLECLQAFMEKFIPESLENKMTLLNAQYAVVPKEFLPDTPFILIPWSMNLVRWDDIYFYRMNTVLGDAFVRICYNMLETENRDLPRQYNIEE